MAPDVLPPFASALDGALQLWERDGFDQIIDGLVVERLESELVEGGLEYDERFRLGQVLRHVKTIDLRHRDIE